jgi:hypothetical protein
MAMAKILANVVGLHLQRDVKLGCTCGSFRMRLHLRGEMSVERHMLRDVVWLHLWREIVGGATPVESIRYVWLSLIVALLN